MARDGMKAWSKKFNSPCDEIGLDLFLCRAAAIFISMIWIIVLLVYSFRGLRWIFRWIFA